MILEYLYRLINVSAKTPFGSLRFICENLEIIKQRYILTNIYIYIYIYIHKLKWSITIAGSNKEKITEDGSFSKRWVDNIM